MADDAFQLWKQRLSRAKEYQSQQHPVWAQSLKLYRMRFFVEQGVADPGQEVVSVNFATTFVKRMLQAGYARNPKIFVRARLARYVRFAEAMETALNYVWDDLDMKNVMIQVYRDALIFGIGWVELGWLDSYGQPVSAQPAPEPAEPEGRPLPQALLARLRTALTGQPDPAALQAAHGPAHGDLYELRQPGRLFARRHSPYRVFYPEGFHHVDEMPYLIVQERLRLRDFLAAEQYQHKEEVAGPSEWRRAPSLKLQTPAYQQTRAAAYTQPSMTQGQDLRVIDLYHCWDRETPAYRVYSDYAEHLVTDWPYYADGFPLFPLHFNDVPEDDQDPHSYPFGDLEPMLPQLIEKSQIRSAMVEHRKRINGAIFVQKGSSTETELQQVQTSLPYMIVPVSNPAAIVKGPELTIPRGLFEVESSIDNDLERESGLQMLLASLQRAGQVDRATIAQIIQSSSNLEISYKVERLEDYSRRLARFMAGTLWQKARPSDVAELIGEFPDEARWPTLPLDPVLASRRIKQELQCRIDAGSTRPPQDETVEREQKIRALAVMQQVAPLLFKQLERPILAQLVKDLGFKDLEGLVLQAIDEQVQATAMQENQLLLQGHPQIVGEVEDHEGHIAIHQQAAGAPLVDQHILAHAQAHQQGRAAQRTTGQGVRQSAAAPSGAEVGRMGVPTMSDLMGQSQNLRAGTGAEASRP